MVQKNKPNYYQVRDWLEFYIPLVYGKEELGLARIEYLLKLLGNPEKKFKSIHVAGTSGKGTTAFYIAKLLESAGFKVGLHVSPHLVDIRERMQIFKDEGLRIKDERLMTMSKFLKLFNEIRPVVEKIQKEKPELTPSYFEILVAASFLHFANEKVDFAVVEVGLGGRLDATNVLQSRIAVITNIGLDHTELLGRTVEKIAYEKAGIIKTHVPIITAAGGKALKLIADIAKKRKAPLVLPAGRQGTIDTQKGQENLLLAVETVMLATKEYHGKKEYHEYHGFSGNLHGRLEEIEKGVILDGAHNVQKIQFLIDFLHKDEGLRIKDKIILIIAFKKGKDWHKMVDLLVKNLPAKKIIATKFYAVTDTGKFSAVEPEEIESYISDKYKGLRIKFI